MPLCMHPGGHRTNRPVWMTSESSQLCDMQPPSTEDSHDLERVGEFCDIQMFFRHGQWISNELYKFL